MTGFTTEGDPIYHDLQFDGEVIHLTYDNSKDKHGGDNRGVTKDVCTEIKKQEAENGEIEFYLSGCKKGDNSFLIRVAKDKLTN